MASIMKQATWILFVFCFLANHTIGQIEGIPFVESYSKEIYGYGTQNWDIGQAENGVMYFANNEGLLEFDGSNWNLFPLPNKTILRSILIQDSVIYGGGQNEFGIYLPDRHKKWRYNSLKPIIPDEHRKFDDVWEIERIGQEIYFRSLEKLFWIRQNECIVLDDIPIQFLGEAGDEIFVQDKGGILYSVIEGKITLIPGSDLLLGTEVQQVDQTEKGVLVATYRKGLFLYDRVIKKWENQGERLFDNQLIDAVNVLDNGDIAIGTVRKGIILVDQHGQYKYHLDREDGLANNRVITTLEDRQRNLWLGLDNGVSMIRINSPFTRIYSNGELEEAGYDVMVYENKIYFGTGSGLYYSDWETGLTYENLSLVENTNGQVWGMDVIDDQLILNHNDGAYIIKGSSASPFFSETGTWLFLKDRTKEDVAIAGTFKGISIFSTPSFEKIQDIEGLSETSRFIVQDQYNDLWMSHPYRGIYRISLPYDPNQVKVELLGTDHGLPSYLHNHIFEINGKIMACGEKGVYSFDRQKQSFVPYDPINAYLGADVKVRRLFEAPGGDIWFITEEDVGVLKMEEQGLTRTISKKVFPELKKLMNGGWEKIYPYEENQVFITTINGFLHFDGNHTFSNANPFDVLIDEVVFNKDSIIYPARTPQNLFFSHKYNSLLFKVSATEYVNNEGVKFQYFLKGFDEDWSSSSTLRAKEYTNLAPGAYEFNVRATNQRGEMSPACVLAFEIEKPWYASRVAVSFYILFFLMTGIVIYRRIQKRYKELEHKIDTTAKKSKQEIDRLEKEKIQSELHHKKRELVSSTLHLVKKNETIAHIADQLIVIKKQSQDRSINTQLHKLVRSLKTNEAMDEGWEQVMFHFNELHLNFFDRLKKAFPTLTPRDLKLCAYLKMNLSTKEMAMLMNVSTRGVEASRYRLRKKLGLSSETNLTEFILDF
jgi:DNA-binding CsgD family transcriptional regulator